MNILLTNDDGYLADGLVLLKEALQKLDFVNLKVLAPAREKSASSHLLSINKTLKIHKVQDDYFYGNDASPTDCVLLAISSIFKDENIDLVISGINKGCNLAEDITYSGTVGAAIEGVLHDIPSIAVSQFYKNEKTICYKLAIDTMIDLVKKIHNKSFPLEKRKFLNINIPDVKHLKCQGICITKMANKLYKNYSVANKIDDNTYKFGANILKFRKNNNTNIITDFDALEQNKVSITPIHLDMTSHSDIENLAYWIEKE